MVSLFPRGATKKQPRGDGRMEENLSGTSPEVWAEEQSESFRYWTRVPWRLGRHRVVVQVSPPDRVAGKVQTQSSSR